MQTYTDRGKEEEESYREVDRRKKKVQRFKHTHTRQFNIIKGVEGVEEEKEECQCVCVCIGLGGGGGEGGRERGQEREKISSKASESGGEDEVK